MLIQQLKDKVIEKGDIPFIDHVLIEDHDVFSLFFLQNLVLNELIDLKGLLNRAYDVFVQVV